METNIAISQKENYTPSAFTKFLWWLATAEKELLADAMIDRNRYAIVGMTVLATWSFATLAWCYFFSTVTNNLYIAIPIGFFMGFIILTIDRALIKGINSNKGRRIGPLLFRGILAITIGVFMAQPALLYMFRKEITLQSSIDNERRKITKRQELNSLYKDRKSDLLEQQQKLSSENKIVYEEVAAARNNFLSETDGSGGSGKIGIKDIALAKKNEYLKLESDYRQQLEVNLPKLNATEVELQKIEDAILAEEQAFKGFLNNGFLTQIEALNHIIKENQALQFRYYLLVILLLLIELMPVIAKILLPNGTYETKVLLRETMEKDMAQLLIDKERSIKELYSTLAQQYDEAIISQFFELTKSDREEKIKTFSTVWKNEEQHTFDGLWKKTKMQILSRPET